MRDISEFDDVELRSAKPWRLKCEALAGMVTGAICLVAAGVLFGVYLATVRYF